MKVYLSTFFLLIVLMLGSCKKNDNYNASQSKLYTPNSFTGVLVSSSVANLTWGDSSSNETGFVIERKANNGTYTKLITLKANINSYSDSSLLPYTTYKYRVYTYRDSTKSSYSNEVIVSNSYSPITSGSTWTYLRNSSDSVYKDSVYKFTSTDSTLAIGDTSFSVINSTSGGNIYYATKDTGYFRRGSLLSSLGIDELSTFSEFYLPKTLTINATWSNQLSVTYQSTPLPITMKYTLKSVGDSLTVLGNKYTNVVHVGATFTTVYFGFTLSLGGGDFYYARGVGLISFNLSTTDPTQPTKPAVTTTFNLKSYLIK